LTQQEAVELGAGADAHVILDHHVGADDDVAEASSASG
jgi:hypothetical protein